MTKPLDRLKRDAPDGPPYLALILDEPTVRALALGVVNARAEVAARTLVDALEAGTLKEKGA